MSLSPTNPDTEPLVSVMMPAYNAEKYIALAIESVLAQAYPHWELIVVNDGSADRTGEIAAQYQDPRIKVVTQANGGESAARNTALDHMQGSLVAFLDSDDTLLPNHLELTVRYLVEHPEMDAVYTDGYHCDSFGQVTQSLSSRRRGPFEGWIFEEVVRASDVFGPPTCVVLRREPILSRKLAFDTSIVIGPDWDFLTRYAETTRFGYVDEATCLYRIHDSNITFSTNPERRALSLALCREKAIRLPGFCKLSVQTRSAVFYDLLIDLLANYPERQAKIVQWQAFHTLPKEERAVLLRLMSTKAMLRGQFHPYIERWLSQSRTLNPEDLKGNLVSLLYSLSPGLCRFAVWLKTRSEGGATELSPFKTKHPS
jgi:glycosyltransferase involved in cell wall biosynthesis